MKQKYDIPDIEVVWLDQQDLLTTSVGGDDETEKLPLSRL